MNPVLACLLAHERAATPHDAALLDLSVEPSALRRVLAPPGDLGALLARRRGRVEIVPEVRSRASRSSRARFDLPVASLDGALRRALHAWQRPSASRQWEALVRLIQRSRGDLVMWRLDEHLELAGYAARSLRDARLRESIARNVEWLTALEVLIYGAEEELLFRGAPLTALFKALDDGSGRWMVEQIVLQPHPLLRAPLSRPWRRRSPSRASR